jgi:hypothetical protein
MKIARIGPVTLETKTEGRTEDVRVEGDWTAKFHFIVRKQWLTQALKFKGKLQIAQMPPLKSFEITKNATAPV